MRSVLWRHKKTWLARLLIGAVFLLLFWRLFCPDPGVLTSSLEWVSASAELGREDWRMIIKKPGTQLVGCSIPVLDPWGEEVKRYVLSTPEVR